MNISFSSVKTSALQFNASDPLHKVLMTIHTAPMSQNVQDLVESTGLTPRDVKAALVQLFQEGVIYQEQPDHYNLTRYGLGIAQHVEQTGAPDYNLSLPTQPLYQRILGAFVEAGGQVLATNVEKMLTTGPAKQAFAKLVEQGAIVQSANGKKYALSTYAKSAAQNMAERAEFAKNERTSVLTKEDMSEEQFQYLNEMYQFFKQRHPEYKVFYERMESDPAKLRSFFNDTRKYFKGGPITSPQFFNPDKMKAYWKSDVIPPQTSLEAAFAHEIGFMVMHAAPLTRQLPSIKDIRTGRTYLTTFQSKATPQRLQRAFSALNIRPGHVLSKGEIDDIVADVVGAAYPATVGDSDSIALGVEQVMMSAIPPSSLVFLPHTPKETIAPALDGTLKAGNVEPFNTFVNTEDNHLLKAVVEMLFAEGADYSNKNLQGLNLGFSARVSIVGVNFSGANLAGAKFTGQTVRNCNFANANMTGVSLVGTTFEKNVLAGADFTDVVGISDEGSKFSLKSNSGIPKNFVMRKVRQEPTRIKDIVAMTPAMFGHSNVVRSPEDELSARAAGRIIREYLQRKNVLASLKFGASPSQTPQGVTDEQVQQLQAWVANEAEVPQFLASAGPAIPDPMQWFAKMNKAKAFTGKLSTADIQTLFGRFRGLTGKTVQHGEGDARQQKTPPPAKPTVESLVAKYQTTYGDAPPTVESLKSLGLDPEGGYAELMGLLGEQVSDKELFNVYHQLVGALNNFHLNSAVAPIRPYSSVPVSSYMSNLVNTKNHVAGAGVQFGIAITPDYGKMPAKVVGPTKTAIDTGGTHLADSIAFSRITPLSYETNDPATGTVVSKYVWYISEMQSDAYQKGNDHLSAEQTAIFRQYYRHWPENLLNTILEQAARAGVDEVWMPPHEEVEIKTRGFSSIEQPGKQANWSMAYDRPAKVFGGQRKNVGVSITLDPKSNYDRKASEFYVIPVKKQAGNEGKTGGLLGALMPFLKFATITPDGFKNMKHHVEWVIEHNRADERFAPYEAYVTDEQLAQFAYDSFFAEYHVDRTPEHEQELKTFLGEEYGYTIASPQFDWLHWIKKAEDDIKYYIHGNTQIQGGSVGKEELGRDWYQDWVINTLPPAIKGSPMKDQFLASVRRMLIDRGYGDVTLTGYVPPSADEDRYQQIVNPPDTGEGMGIGPDGGELPEEPPQGDLAETEKPAEPTIQFAPPGEHEQRGLVQEEIDRLLDKMKNAQTPEEKERIRRRLHEISTLATLRFETLVALANGSLLIEPVQVEDRQHVLSLRADVFSAVSSQAPPAEYYDRIVDWDLCRKVTTADGRTVGAYLLGRRDMPSVIASIPGVQVFEDLSKYAGKKGVEGVSVFIEKPFRGRVGSRLLDVPYGIPDVDYIWGLAHKRLGNIENWKQRRRVIAESDQMYVTVVDLPKTLRFAAVDQEFTQGTPPGLGQRNDWFQYEPAHGEAAPVGGGPGGGGSPTDTSNSDMKGGFYTDLNLPDPHKKDKQMVSFEPSNHVNLQTSIATFDFTRFKTSALKGIRSASEFKNMSDSEITAKLQAEWEWAQRMGIV
jgi:hypothetical protein